MKKITILLSLCVSMLMVANAQFVYFEENFDDGAAYDRWTMVEDGEYVHVPVADFDYISEGIEAAPNGGGLGLQIAVNIAEAPDATGDDRYVLAYPTGQSFTGNYTLSFDMYLSYTVGGSGTTEAPITGVGHSDLAVPSTQEYFLFECADGYDFGITADNGASADLRAYEAGYWMDDEDVVYGNPDAESMKSSEAQYYLDSYIANDNDSTPGNQWLQVKIDVTDSEVSYYINDLLWMEIPVGGVEGNIMIGYADYWGSIADEVSFVIFDNVKVTAPVGVAANKSAIEVSLYPNPAKDNLTIEVAEQATVELVNSIGQVVISKDVFGKETIDIANLSNGVYFAKVTDLNGNSKTQKVVVE